MKNATLAASLVCALSCAGSAAHAQDRSGVRPEVLSMPSGPGSVEGLGESFEPSASSGTSSYSVPVRVPPGVAGFQPSVVLRYSSGAPNGELGLGWTLGLPSVQRGTDRGLPRYDATDRFVLRGMEGRGAEDLAQLDDGSFRFRIEGAFVRGRQHADGTWEFRNRSGVRFTFGTADTALIREGANVFAWLLTEQIDTHGNSIRYEYERGTDGHPYLARIVYNDFDPTVRNEVILTYEDRPDPLTSFVPTFANTIARRLSRIDVKHGGSPVRSYALGYEMLGGLSRLVSVQLTGSDGMLSLPTLRLEYVAFDASASGVMSMASAPARALGDVTEIDDIDGDALPDLLTADPTLDGGLYSWVPNMDGTSFGTRSTIATSPSAWLSSPNVQLADMDGDGAADVVARVSAASDGLRYYPGASAGFGAAVVITPAPSFGFEDPDVRLVDLNHDRRTDWMRIEPVTGDVTVAFNQGGGIFTAGMSVPPIATDEVVSFSRTGLRLSDMNGDGLLDAVAVRDRSVRYWASRGYGLFDAGRDLTGAPALSAGELTQIEVRDLNGDGASDIVLVGVTEVRYWLNQAGSSLDVERMIAGTPERRASTVVRVADMNGNGTADIVWADPTATSPWQYLDLMPQGPPGLLRRITNGLGRVVTIEYAGLGEMRRWARDQGIAWTRRSPMGQTVVFRISDDDGLGTVTHVEMRYADAYFDGAAREFRGFGHAFRSDLGDASQPTLVTESLFDLGDTDEARKGMPLSTARWNADRSQRFDADDSTLEVRTLAMAANGDPIRFAFRRVLDRSVYELGTTPVTIRTEWDYDEFGNVIREARYGRVEGADVTAGNDESVSIRTYATSTSDWIVDRVASVRVEDAAGTRFSEQRTYYDGEPFVGLALGQVTVGDATRVESWIEDSRFADEMSNQFDAHGNAVVRLDARGGRHEIDYDTASHTFVVAERVFPDAEHPIAFSGEYDGAFGLLTSMRDANGQQHRARYDALGRLVALIEPGDTEALPTRTYEYRLGAPTSSIRTEQRERSGETSTIVTLAIVDSRSRTRGTFAAVGGGRFALSGATNYGARGWSAFAARPSFERSADLPSIDDGRTGVRSTYDALGRVFEETEPDGAVRRREYGPLFVRAYDENDTDTSSPHYDTPTRTVSDGLGRTISVVQLDGAREVPTTFEYDPLGNLRHTVDAEGRERRYVFDGRSRRTQVEDPNAGVWQFSFNDGNDLESRMDAEANTIRFLYDAIGRPTEEWHQRASDVDEHRSVAFHYDAPHVDHPELGFLVGQTSWVEDDAGIIFFGYDARGRGTDRVRRFADGREYLTATDFDTADRVIRRGFPDGMYLDLEYDERGMVNRVGPLVTDVTYTAWGMPDTISFGNGVVDTHEYDGRQRLRGMRAVHDGLALRDLFYSLDAASRIENVDDRRTSVSTERDLSAVYGYDDLYRLTDIADSTGSTTYHYDDVANILSVSSDDSAPFLNVTSTFGENGAGPDALTHFGAEQIHYDAAGRVTADGERVLEWDARGRLSRVTRGDTVEEYVYGFDDTRVIKRTAVSGRVQETRYIDRDVEERNGHLVRYAFLGDHRAVRLDALTPDDVSYGASVAIHRGDLLLPWWAIALFGLFMMLVPRKTRRGAALLSALALLSCDGSHHDRMLAPIEDYPRTAVLYLADLAGSPVAEVNETANLLTETAYRAYGSARSETGAGAEPFAYVGNEADRGSGLADFGARPMRPEIGRFYAVDPMSITGAVSADMHPSALQAYTYSAGDPINAVDAHGEFVIGIGIGGQLAFGVVGEGGAGIYLEITASRAEVGFYSTLGAGAGISGGGEFSVQVTVSPGGTAADVWGSPSVSVSAGLHVGGGISASIAPNLEHPLASSVTLGVGLGASVDIVHASVSIGQTAPIISSDGRASQPTPDSNPRGERHAETRAERRMDAAGTGFDGGTPRASSASHTASTESGSGPATSSSAPESTSDGCGQIMSCQ